MQSRDGKKFLQRGAIFYDDLPQALQRQLERIKDTESLWTDVERYLGSNHDWDSYAKPVWGKKEFIARELVKVARDLMTAQAPAYMVDVDVLNEYSTWDKPVKFKKSQKFNKLEDAFIYLKTLPKLLDRETRQFSNEGIGGYKGSIENQNVSRNNYELVREFELDPKDIGIHGGPWSAGERNIITVTTNLSRFDGQAFSKLDSKKMRNLIRKKKMVAKSLTAYYDRDFEKEVLRRKPKIGNWQPQDFYGHFNWWSWDYGYDDWQVIIYSDKGKMDIDIEHHDQTTIEFKARFKFTGDLDTDVDNYLKAMKRILPKADKLIRKWKMTQGW
jgi:hypothetical protein